jgi:hypothetical protein
MTLPPKGIVILKICQEFHRIYAIGIIPQLRVLAVAKSYHLVFGLQRGGCYNALQLFALFCSCFCTEARSV